MSQLHLSPQLEYLVVLAIIVLQEQLNKLNVTQAGIKIRPSNLHVNAVPQVTIVPIQECQPRLYVQRGITVSRQEVLQMMGLQCLLHVLEENTSQIRAPLLNLNVLIVLRAMHVLDWV